MLDGLASWNRDHTNFAVLLDLFERELDLFHTGESPDYDLMTDIMFYMIHYTDVIHHPREDLAFAQIKSREPAAAAAVGELEAEIRHVEDPVFGRNLDERYAALRAQIAREARLSANAALR
jgi:hemerythrin-like domain-containing protein